jgi:hypothetical protein
MPLIAVYVDGVKQISPNTEVRVLEINQTMAI